MASPAMVERVFYAGISLALQRLKGELCVSMNQGHPSPIFFVMDWIQVLKHFGQSGYISNWLTIPFLIGSQQFPDPTSEFMTIEEFMTDAAEGSCVTLMKCNLIGEYVVGLLDR
jgi:hypothetical protein